MMTMMAMTMMIMMVMVMTMVMTMIMMMSRLYFVSLKLYPFGGACGGLGVW